MATLYFDENDGLLCYKKDGSDELFEVKTKSGLEVKTGDGETVHQLLINTGEDGSLQTVKNANDEAVEFAFMSDIDAIDNKISQLQTNVDTQQSNLSEMQNTVNAQTQNVGQLQQSFNALDQKAVTKEKLHEDLLIKQDKTSDELKTAYKEIPKAINEVLQNVWNPVLYNYIKDSGTNFSPSNIVLDENGRMKLTYKQGSDAAFELPPLYITDINGKFVTFATLFKDYPSLNTTDKTLIGAINELASFHDLSDSYFTTYSNSTSLIDFTQLDLTVESSSQMYKLTGVVKSSIDNGQTNACLVAVPKDRAYNDPSAWKDKEYEYHNDIIIVAFDETFELAESKSINDYNLYVCFVSPSIIKGAIPSGFGYPDAWQLQVHAPFTTYPVTIMVSNLQLLPVEPTTTEYLTPEIQDQVNALSEKVTQLENELNLANDTISTLLTKIEWLDQLDQEGLVKSWGKEANS